MPGNITCIFIILICLILSAYFSATETAYSSLNKTRLRAMAEDGSKKASLALALSEKYDKLISTVLIGNNIANITAATLAAVLFIRLYGEPGAAVSAAVATAVVLIFGEISPKSLAQEGPERFAMFSAPFLSVLMGLLTPLNFLFSLWKKLLSRLFKTDPDAKMSQAELLMLVEEVEQKGSIDEDEGELLKNAIEFTDRQACEVLTHRVDLEAVSIDAGRDEIARVFSESRFSRLPVYRDNIDNIVGIIHQKDFFTCSGIADSDLSDIMSPPLFIPETEKIGALLRLLQKNKAHLAVVLDEYGGTCGIITMEDILEELVGEIWDEHDEVTEEFHKTAGNVYQVDGSVEFDQFRDFFALDADSEMTSLSGWVMEVLGCIPGVGDSFRWGDYLISVTEADGHRASKVEVRREPAEPQVSPAG